MNIKDIKYVKMALTYKCNSNCLTCWHSNKNSTPPAQDISEKTYIHIRDKLFKHIKILDLISGGELFLYKHIDILLEDIKKYKFRTIIESSFAIMNDKQRDMLKDANVNFVVSLDGSHKELQNFLRPNCSYDTVINNIKFFKKHKKRITIRTTVSNYNFYDMEDMIKLGEELNVNGIIFHGVQYLDSLETPYKFSKPPEDIDYIRNIVKKHFKINYDVFLDYYRRNSTFLSVNGVYYCIIDPITAQSAGISVKLRNIAASISKKECCPIARNFIKINVDGKIYFCSNHECKSIGDLYKNSLEEIIENKEYNKIRESCTCKISKRFLCK